MTTEQKEAIETIQHWIEYEKQNKDKINKADELIEIQETVLNLIQEQEAEIQKKDDIVRRVINRLNNDIKRIRKARAKNYYNDYRRCRLKAYKTKTREIKEYIEEVDQSRICGNYDSIIVVYS